MEEAIQVGKRGDSLAVRLPAALVESLGLKEGDEVEIEAAGARTLVIEKDRRREEALARLKELSRPFPPDFRFNREEAHAHEGR